MVTYGSSDASQGALFPNVCIKCPQNHHYHKMYERVHQLGLFLPPFWTDRSLIAIYNLHSAIKRAVKLLREKLAAGQK